MQVFLMLPGNGGPHAIFLPLQKRQASTGFLGMFVVGKELRPIDGDCAEFKRNSVGGVNGQGVAYRDNVSDGLGSDWPLISGESRWLRSDN